MRNASDVLDDYKMLALLMLPTSILVLALMGIAFAPLYGTAAAMVH